MSLFRPLQTAAFVCGSVDECLRFLKTLKAEGRIEAFAIFSRKGSPILEGALFDQGATAPGTAAETGEGPGVASTETIAALRDLALLVKAPRTNIALGARASPIDCAGLDLCSLTPLLVSVQVDTQEVAEHGGAEAGVQVRVGVPEKKLVATGRVFATVPAGGRTTIVLVEVISVVDAQIMSTATAAAAVELKALMGGWPALGSVITLRAVTGSLHALTASSMRLLAEEGLLMFNVQKASKAHLALAGIEGAEVAVHLLAGAEGEALGRAFARETDLSAAALPAGVTMAMAEDVERAPRLAPAGRTLVARVRQVVDAGDHSILLCGVGAVEGAAGDELLVWKDKKFVQAASLRA